ncbi:MAG: CPBP family intramembrane metalloprotease [Rhizobiales bacterium]|nr:CPBP family intramembrane metalloprotease [Hyphomicrobiales bacterium]
MSLTTDGRSAPPWGILASCAWLLGAFFISFVVAAGVFVALQPDAARPLGSTYDGVVITIGAMASTPIQIAVLAIAAQLRRWRPADYLALNVPRRGEIIVAVICIAVLCVAFDAILYLVGRDLVPTFQLESYRTAQNAGWLLWLTLAIVVVAPIGEEIAFRGFLYRGLARPGREMLAIAIIALAWAMLHIQYDWIGMAQIFTAGLILGWFRWASGSTTLTIIMHVLVNAEAMLETWIKIQYFS